MEITCKVKVDLLHWEHLCITATGSTTLHTETRAKGWFPECHYGLLPYLVHTQSKTHRHCGLSDTRFSRGNGCYQDKIAVLYPLFVDQRDIHFRHMASVVCHIIFRYAIVSGKFLNLHELRTASYLYICHHNISIL